MRRSITSWACVVVLWSCKGDASDPHAALPERITAAHDMCGRCKANDPRAPVTVACAYTWRGACRHDTEQMCADYVPCDAACCPAEVGPVADKPSTNIADAARLDLENVCHALIRSGANARTDASERATLVAAWLNERLATAEVKELMDSLATMPPPERAEVLRARAKSVGVDPCPFVDDP